MGIGREVADAYIDVHGDLSSFRRDLDKAGGFTAEKAAMNAADDFSEAWGKRIEQDVNGKWGDIVDAMYSNKAIDWDKLLGTFDSTNLDEMQSKVKAFVEDMRKSGKLTQEQFEGLNRALEGQVNNLKETAKAADRADQEVRGLGMAMDANRKFMADMAAENEKWARSWEGIRKNANISGMEDDFKRLATAMSFVDLGKFAKSFDDLDKARARIHEVTAAMEEQGRISAERAAELHNFFNAFMEDEAAKSKAMRDALDETNRLKKAQDDYNQSLSGMARNSHFADLEGQFRSLAAAMDSNDWSKFAKGAKDSGEFRDNVMSAATEMHRLGRMSDQELSLIGDRISHVSRNMSAYNIEFRRARDNADGFGKVMGNALSRSANLFTRLGNITKGFREHLGGFAGLNVFGDMIEGGFEFIHNLDRIALSIGKNTIMMSTMASVGASAFAGLITVAGDLAGIIGGLAVAAPAFAVGAGIGIGVLIAAMKDMKTVLADLKPAFAELQDQISSSFWKEAAGPIREMVKTLMPILTPNLKGTATALGGLVGKLAKAFRDIPADSINTMFDRMNKSIDILGNAMPPLVRAFTTLGLTGSKYFERFTTWIVSLSDQFDKFIQKSAENGDLDKWINNMIEGFKNIGRSIDGAMGIFNALNRAAERAGFGGLKTFADALQRAADIMNTPEFQTTLSIYLIAVRDLALKLGKAISDLGPAFESFAPTAATALGSVGDAVTKIIGYVGDIFSNPKFQEGVATFTSKLDEAIGRLEPAVKPFADSLGNALTLLGNIAISIADVATAMVVNWSPVLDSMSKKMETLVTPLKEAVVKAIEDLTPILEGIDKNIVGPLVAAFTDKGGLFDVLTGPGGLTEKLGQAGSALTKDFGDLIKPLIGEGGVLPGLVKVVGELVGPLGQLFDLFTPTLQSLLEGIGTALNNLANDIKVLKGEVPFEDLSFFKRPTDDEIKAKMKDELRIQSWGEILAELLTGSISTGIGQAAEKIWTEGIAPWLAGIWGNLVTSWNNAWSGNGIAGTDQGKKQGDDFVNGWNKGWNDFWEEGGPITKMQKEFAKWVKSIDWGQMAKDLWDGFLNAMVSENDRKGFEDVVKGFTGWLQGVLDFFGIHSPSTKMFEVAGDIVAGFLNGFGGFAEEVGKVWEGIKTTVSTKFEELKAGLATAWEGFKTGWNDFWGGVGETIGTRWEEFKTTVSTKWTELSTGLSTAWEGFKTGWDTFWADTGTTLSTNWESFKTTVSTKWDELNTGMTTAWDGFKTGWSTFWTDTGTTLSTNWENFKTTVGTKATEIKTGVDTWATDFGNGWNGFWGDTGKNLGTAWDGFVGTTKDKAGDIKTNIDNFGSDVGKNWNNFWGGVGTNLTNAWNDFTGTTDRKSGEIESDVNDMANTSGDRWSNWLGSMNDQVNSSFQNFANIVASRVGDIVNWVAGMPGRILGAIGNFSGLLWNAGWNIMTGFYNGLVSMWGNVQNFVGGVANWIAENKGPLAYDRVLLEPAGKAIMSGLDNGIRSGMDPLLNTLQTITAAVSDTVTADLSKSVMYSTGVDAAQGLADGLKANRSSVHTALGNLGAFTVPASQITVAGSFAGSAAGRPSADVTPGRSVTIAEGAIKIETPTKSPELVAAKVIDSFVNYSTF